MEGVDDDDDEDGDGDGEEDDDGMFDLNPGFLLATPGVKQT